MKECVGCQTASSGAVRKESGVNNKTDTFLSPQSDIEAPLTLHECGLRIIHNGRISMGCL